MARWLALLCTLAAAQQCPGADDDALTLSTKSRAELDQLRACVLGTTAIDRTVTRILLAGTDAALTDARVVKLDASLPVKQRAQFFAAARVVVGAGAALALPLLEGMVHGAEREKELPRRMCCVFFPFGVATPKDDSEDRQWGWFRKC